MSYPSGTIVWLSNTSSSFETLHRIAISVSVHLTHQLHESKSIHVRKEQRPTIRQASILPKHPEVVSTNKTLEARPKLGIAEVHTQLNRLVHGAVPVTEIRALRCAEVDVEAFLRTELHESSRTEKTVVVVASSRWEICNTFDERVRSSGQ